MSVAFSLKHCKEYSQVKKTHEEPCFFKTFVLNLKRRFLREVVEGGHLKLPILTKIAMVVSFHSKSTEDARSWHIIAKKM